MVEGEIGKRGRLLEGQSFYKLHSLFTDDTVNTIQSIQSIRYSQYDTVNTVTFRNYVVIKTDF